MIYSIKKFLGLLMLVIFVSFSVAQNTSSVRYLEFNDLSGEKVTFNEFKGEITVINFWATWCAACLKEMPELQKISQDFADNQVRVVGIVVMSDTGKIEQMIKLTKISYPVFVGTRQNLQNISHSLIIPQTIILNEQGRILKKFEGAQNYKVIANFLNDYLNRIKLTRHNENSQELLKE